jgi:phosphoserine phosphatase RsbU/P
MKTILFADDNKSIREFCRATFEAEGYRVLLARDGIEALRVFVMENPDVAVLDVSMPRASGLEILEQIKGISSQTPVILFTAHYEDCAHDHRAVLADACVEKAENLDELKHAVAHVVEPVSGRRRAELRESSTLVTPMFPSSDSGGA